MVAFNEKDSEEAMVSSPAQDVGGKPSFSHVPVMLDKVLAEAQQMQPGVFLDATLGGAGHAKAVLQANPNLRLIGVDQDASAIEAASDRLAEFGDRVQIVNCNFSSLPEVLVGVELSGFLFDLGVSSHQLDTPERGFAYRLDGPLDMRMNSESPLSADNVVNDYEPAELRRVISEYSDEKFAHRIAKAIVTARPVHTTGQLAEIVVSAIPAAARRTGGNPAKRTFQAIRIEVNSELEILEGSIISAIRALSVGGRGLVMTYHSGEDKIVKSIYNDLTVSSDPPGLPMIVDVPAFRKSSPQVVTPNETELAENRRSQSARLRIIERTAA